MKNCITHLKFRVDGEGKWETSEVQNEKLVTWIINCKQSKWCRSNNQTTLIIIFPNSQSKFNKYLDTQTVLHWKYCTSAKKINSKPTTSLHWTRPRCWIENLIGLPGGSDTIYIRAHKYPSNKERGCYNLSPKQGTTEDTSSPILRLCKLFSGRHTWLEHLFDISNFSNFGNIVKNDCLFNSPSWESYASSLPIFANIHYFTFTTIMRLVKTSVLPFLCSVFAKSLLIYFRVSCSA